MSSQRRGVVVLMALAGIAVAWRIGPERSSADEPAAAVGEMSFYYLGG